MKLSAARVGLLGLASPRAFAAPAAALPRRRLPPPALRRVLASAAIGNDGQQPGPPSELLRMATEAGGKLTKTAVGRLTVAELRTDCQRLGLSNDGLKAALVDRLMAWWEEQGKQQRLQGQQEDGPAAEAGELPMPAAGAAMAAAGEGEHTARPKAQQSEEAQQQVQQVQQAQQQRQRAQLEPGGPVSVTWLGTSSGNPTPRRNVSAIAVQFGENFYLVDCGEGTHNQLRRMPQLHAANARAIFVTHMHGDHCFGVGGVLAAVQEARRGTLQQGEPLLLFGPPELQSLVLAAVRAGNLVLTTPVVVTGFVLDPQRARHPTKVDDSGMLLFALQPPDQGDRLPPQRAKSWQAAYDQGSEKIVQQGLSWSVRIPGAPLVTAAQLQHRVPCWGYVFQEPPAAVPPPPPPSAADNANDINSRSGAAACVDSAAAAAADAATVAGSKGQQWVQRGRKLVILGDTCDSSAIAPLALGCDLLSHEATFCSGMEKKAAIAQHSTTLQAGAFAAAVEAQRLVLTHFSARYESVASAAASMPRGGGGGGRGGRGGAAPEASDLRRSDLVRLLDETYSTYGRDTLDLAHDFFTVEVPPPAPMPAAQLQEVQARQARQAAAVVEAAQAAARAHAAPQRYQQRRQGGDGYQQRRQGGEGYQRRQGGEGYQQRRQGEDGYQQRRQGEDGYQQRRQGEDGYQQRRQGGDKYQQRRPSGDGYQQRRPSGEGYQQRRQGEDGYQQRRQGDDGYQQRRQGGDKYQQRRPSGDGYQQRRPSGDGYQQRRQGGESYQERRSGGGDGYQQRGHTGGGSGGYQQRSGGSGGYQQRREGGGSYQQRREGGGSYQQRRPPGDQQGWQRDEE
ncbi:hypothetical protein ABPG75_003327 [Micractinium tetrahymenae]